MKFLTKKEYYSIMSLLDVLDEEERISEDLSHAIRKIVIENYAESLDLLDFIQRAKKERIDER